MLSLPMVLLGTFAGDAMHFIGVLGEQEPMSSAQHTTSTVLKQAQVLTQFQLFTRSLQECLLVECPQQVSLLQKLVIIHMEVAPLPRQLFQLHHQAAVFKVQSLSTVLTQSRVQTILV